MKHKSIFVSAGAVMASFAAYANSPFISKVLDFCPAPGQFVNVVPEIPSDATEEDVNAIVLGQAATGIRGWFPSVPMGDMWSSRLTIRW